MRRWTKGVALAAALGMSLAACSSGDDSGSDTGSGSTGGSLLIWADEKRAGPIGDLAKSWGEENDVSVEVTQINFEDLKDQFTQQVPAGQGPDIMLGQNAWAGDFVPSGLISPVDLGANRDQFAASAVEAFTVNGQTYGVPIAMDNIIMFRNTDLVPDAPATANEMGEIGLKLQKEGKTKYPVGLQVGDRGDMFHAFPFFTGAGGYFFGGPDAEGNYDTSDLGVDSPGAQAWAEAFSQWGKDGVVKSTFVQDDLRQAWVDGALPFWITGPWEKAAVMDSGVPFSAEPVPAWEGSDSPAVPVVGAHGFFLNQNSDNKTTAQAFLDATMNTEFMNEIYQADPRPPAWLASAEAVSDDPIDAALAEWAANGYPNLAIAAMNETMSEMDLAELKILNGEDPTTVLQEAKAAIESRIN